MRAAIYARVSTDEQAEKGSSIGTQVAECRRYAEFRDYEVIAEFKDDISGKIPLFQRPEGSKLQSLVASGDIRAIIVYRVDRLSRDLVDILIVTREWLRAGIDIYVMDLNDKIKSENDIVLVVKGWQGGDEHSKIVERTLAGRYAKARAGNWVGAGYAPYGYRKEGERKNTRLVIYPPEAEVVKNMFEWYVNGDGANGLLSLRGIIRKLREIGAVTSSNRKDSAQYWIPSSIRNLFKNEIYIGVTHYGKSKMVNKKRIKVPPEDWIRIDVPELAIVPEDIFREVQARANKNRERARRNRKHDYLISGFIHCGSCGKAFIGMRHGNDFRYRCSSDWYIEEHYGPCSYKNKSILSSRADELVWNWVSKLVQDEDGLEAGLAKMGDKRKAELQPKRERLNIVAGMIEKVERKIKRLTSSWGDEEDDTIADAIKNELKTISKQREALVTEAQRIESELSMVALTPEIKEGIRRQARRIREKLSEPTYKQKRELFDAVDLRVTVRIDAEARWLDVSCELKPDGDVIVLHPLKTASPLPLFTE